MLLEKPLEGPLDSKEIKPVNPKDNQPWIFTERTNDEAESPILCPLDAKNQLVGKIEGKRRKQQQTMKWLDSITNSVAINLNKFQERVEDRGAWSAMVHTITKSWT